MLAPDLAASCAPNVHFTTMVEVVRVESQGNPLALHVNNLVGPQPKPARDARHAAQIARHYIARGHSVDIGIAQINSRNLRGLNMTVEQALEPCDNLRASATILGACYNRALHRFAAGRPALLATFSCYQSNNFTTGFHNGYVARYLPALPPSVRLTPPPQMAAATARPSAQQPPAATPPVSWGGVVEIAWAELVPK